MVVVVVVVVVVIVLAIEIKTMIIFVENNYSSTKNFLRWGYLGLKTVSSCQPATPAQRQRLTMLSCSITRSVASGLWIIRLESTAVHDVLHYTVMLY